MKIIIKNRFTFEVMFEGEEASLRVFIEKLIKSDADLRGADLGYANLHGADLHGADLRGIKNYSENHYIFMELIKRQSIKAFLKS